MRLRQSIGAILAIIGDDIRSRQSLVDRSISSHQITLDQITSRPSLGAILVTLSIGCIERGVRQPAVLVAGLP